MQRCVCVCVCVCVCMCMRVCVCVCEHIFLHIRDSSTNFSMPSIDNDLLTSVANLFERLFTKCDLSV